MGLRARLPGGEGKGDIGVRIYVASSWRNDHQPEVVSFLRKSGHDVYDFRHPRLGDDGFHWSEIDPYWETWTPEEYTLALETRFATDGFKSDMDALKWCDACVLVMPCGRSAHLELGWAVGAGKITVIYLPPGEPFEPELMYLMAGGITTRPEGILARLKL